MFFDENMRKKALIPESESDKLPKTQCFLFSVKRISGVQIFVHS